MNKKQKSINNATKIILENEEWLYGIRIHSFYSMRKYVKRVILKN